MERLILTRAELEAFDPQNPANATGGGGRGVRYLCPLCGQGKPKDSAHRCLSVDLSSGAWNCFRCGQKGKLRDNWDEKPFQNRERAKHNLSRAFSLDIVDPQSAPTEAIESPQAALNGVSNWHMQLRGLQPLENTRGTDYLESRALALDVCFAARLKWAPSWLGRPAVVFPITDQNGGMVAAQGRYTDDRKDPKTRTLGPKKEGVFLTGDFWSQIKKGAPIVFTEAPIDALSVATCGFPALALCGKDGLPTWLPIKCAFKNVVLAFDNDEAGELAATKMAPILRSLGAKVRRVSPLSKDWNCDLEERGRAQLEDFLIERFLAI